MHKKNKNFRFFFLSFYYYFTNLIYLLKSKSVRSIVEELEQFFKLIISQLISNL